MTTPVAPVAEQSTQVAPVVDLIPDSVSRFFHALTQASTWIRVGEIIGGALLVYAGVAGIQMSLSGTTPKQLIKVASKVI